MGITTLLVVPSNFAALSVAADGIMYSIHGVLCDLATLSGGAMYFRKRRKALDFS